MTADAVLLTGATGLLGRYLVRDLSARGQRVRNRQPDGGAIGDGGSPTGTVSVGRTSGSGIGIASIKSAV